MSWPTMLEKYGLGASTLNLNRICSKVGAGAFHSVGNVWVIKKHMTGLSVIVFHFLTPY
jgi:hypothetical protein